MKDGGVAHRGGPLGGAGGRNGVHRGRAVNRERGGWAAGPGCSVGESVGRVAAALTVALTVALTPVVTAAEPGETWLGVGVGAHVVITDWDVGFIDRDGRRVSPGADPITRLRLGHQLTAHLAAEASLAHLPLVTDAGLATALAYDLDLRLRLADAFVVPWAVVGGGAWHVFGATEGDDLDLELHYGLDLRARLTPHVALRGGFRHVLSDALDADLAASSAIELGFGFDLTWGGDGP